MLIGIVLAACSFVLIYITAPTLWVVEHTSYAAFARGSRYVGLAPTFWGLLVWGEEFFFL